MIFACLDNSLPRYLLAASPILVEIEAVSITEADTRFAGS